MAVQLTVTTNTQTVNLSVQKYTPSGVQTITGDGVGGTATNPVLSFPNPVEIGAIEEAPEDGNIYGRKDGDWVEVSVDDELTPDDLAGIQNANGLSAANPAATMGDISDKTEKGGYEGTAQDLKDELDAIAGGSQGAIAISDTPTEIGYYYPTESGTYTNAGGLVVDLTDGITILIYDGTNWGMQVVPVDLEGYATLDNLLNGYSEENENLFASANYVLERILSDGVSRTTYSAGTYQTAVAGGLKLDPPTSGSAGNTFFLNTGVVRDVNKAYSLNITLDTNNGVSSDSCGVSFNDAGQYQFILIRTNGIVAVGSIGNTNGGIINVKTTELKPFSVGTTITFKFFQNHLSIFINNIFYFSYEINEDYAGVIYPMQAAFSAWVFNLETQFTTTIADTNFFEFDTIGNNPFDERTGLIRFFQKIKNSNKYIGYRIGRFKDSRDLIYADNWNIANAYVFEWNGYFMFNSYKVVLASGNSELALKESSAKDDFVGGNHGDEIQTDFKVYLNGVIQDISQDITLTPCDSMQLMQKSTLHSAPESGVFVPGHPEIATRIKYLKFMGQGYSIFNRIEFTVSQLITLIYHNMFCVANDFGKFIYSDFDFTTEEMTDSQNQFINELGYREVYYFNDDNNFSAFATSKVLNSTSKDEGAELFVSDRIGDSKYYRQVPAFAPAVGEIFESFGEIKFEIK